MLVAVVAPLGGCHGFDPVGSYHGDATRSGEVTRMSSDLGADGSAKGHSDRFLTKVGTTVTVTRVDDSHLNVDIGDSCRLRVARSPTPKDHYSIVDDPQSCQIAVKDFSGSVVFVGTVQFDRKPPGVHIDFDGDARIGDPNRAGFTTLQYGYVFDGHR